jgi:arsenate reductase
LARAEFAFVMKCLVGLANGLRRLRCVGLSERLQARVSGGFDVIVYGLDTCAVCQRAIKELAAAGQTVIFRDVRADPLSAAELDALIVEFGDRLVDRKSTDWRGLSDWLKNSEAEDQLAAKPKLMVRPVIVDGDRYFLGWDDKVQAAILSV